MASLRARQYAFVQTPNFRDDLGTLSWTPPGVIHCHLRADAELLRQRCTLATALDFFVALLYEQCVPLHFALFSERNPALVTHEVFERCSYFLPRALTFLAHPTLAANPNPALDHTPCLALQLDTSSQKAPSLYSRSQTEVAYQDSSVPNSCSTLRSFRWFSPSSILLLLPCNVDLFGSNTASERTLRPSTPPHSCLSQSLTKQNKLRLALEGGSSKLTQKCRLTLHSPPAPRS